MADRGGRHPQLARGTGDAAFFEQRLEHDKEIKVDAAKVVGHGVRSLAPGRIIVHRRLVIRDGAPMHSFLTPEVATESDAATNIGQEANAPSRHRVTELSARRPPLSASPTCWRRGLLSSASSAASGARTAIWISRSSSSPLTGSANAATVIRK